MKGRIGIRARCQQGYVTAGAVQRREDLLAGCGCGVCVGARQRSEKAHEALEVVDAAPPGPGVGDILGVRDHVAHPHLLGADPKGHLCWEQVVGDDFLSSGYRACGEPQSP